MKTIKVIDLKKRTIYVDDIEQIYCDNSYIPERYNIQTTYGTYLVDKEDYFKVKDYLLSLNDEVEIINNENWKFKSKIEEDKKIEHIENYVDFVNLNDSEKFDYLYEMETRIINYINKEKK